ncbi:MAG: dihydropteroate synthase [Chlorobiales bacterium]|nr:dihydropteroate synthase [Chlorobiales bacterium]
MSEKNRNFPEDYFILDFHGHRLNFLERPYLMSILNVTPDSFSDGGKFVRQSSSEIDYDAAIESAEKMVREGADMIDVGGESTRPGSLPVTAEEEIRRTAPLIERLVKKVSVPISIDTHKADVAEAALKAGASMVNDISGFRFDPGLPDVCRRYDAPAVLMHLREKPGEMSWSYNEHGKSDALILDVKKYLSDALAIADAHRVSHTIIDVGFGFGKTVDGNYELLARLQEFQSLKRPILAGLSRKSFIGKAVATEAGEVAPVDERLYGTLAANTIALLNGANILRVHDTKPARDAIKVFVATKQALEKAGFAL